MQRVRYIWASFFIGSRFLVFVSLLTYIDIDLQQYEPTAGDEEDVTNEITGKFPSEKIREVSPKLSVEPHRVFDVNGKAQTHSSILAKASNLLRESLDVDYTVFLDVNPELGPNSFCESDPSLYIYG